MPEKKNGPRVNPLALAVVSAVLGGTGGPFLLVKLGGPSVMAPDRYTGTQALALEERVAALEAHVEDHPDVQLRADIATLTAEIAGVKAAQDQIISNQDRILDRLIGQ